jgi:hypothetical protein
MSHPAFELIPSSFTRLSSLFYWAFTLLLSVLFVSPIKAQQTNEVFVTPPEYMLMGTWKDEETKFRYVLKPYSSAQPQTIVWAVTALIPGGSPITKVRAKSLTPDSLEMDYGGAYFKGQMTTNRQFVVGVKTFKGFDGPFKWSRVADWKEGDDKPKAAAKPLEGPKKVVKDRNKGIKKIGE